MSAGFDQCIKCTICQTQCPVVRAFPEFPGPKSLGPESERLAAAKLHKREMRFHEISPHLASCTGCRRCDAACPHGVRPSHYIVKRRPLLEIEGLKALRNWILAHNGWWGSIAAVAPRLMNAALRLYPLKAAMGLAGIAPREFPKYRRRRISSKGVKGKSLLYFPGCYASFNEPAVIQAAVDILEACGYAVEVFPPRCCGTPMFTNAFIDEARALAQRNAAELSACVERGSTIVTTCPSCGLALRSEYDDLLGVEGPASLVWDLFELLEFEEKDPFRKVELKLDRAYYHVPCHLRSLGAGAPAARFLARYAVRDLKVSDEYCCGLAGTFGFKKEKFALSMEIGGPLFDAVRKSGAPLAITDCGTCALQIALGAGVEVKHPAVVMRELL